MDLSTFKVSDWLIICGGAVFLFFAFVDWFRFDDLGGPNGFDFSLTGLVPWLLMVGAGVVTFAIAGGFLRPAGMPWPLVVLLATGLATLLVLLRTLIGFDVEGVDYDRAAGLWVCLLCTFVSTAGAVLAFQADGGHLRDLTDKDKLGDAFRRRKP
ncbi:hypothetical protein BH24ACT5_BH24ACT5_06380 [soil metagenome]